MPRIIVKCRYYKGKSSRSLNLGGLMKYIATRDGVEKLPKEDSYLRYMGTRPRVEKIEGTHGLFSSEGKEINLEDEVKKLEEHIGNVYSVIISITREDAERLGYSRAEKWRDMIRANIDKVAEAHNIKLENLSWYGAFHNESHHPHVHMLLYSTDPNEPGYISKSNTDKLRHLFGTEIFKDEIHEIYDKQTSVRNEITKEMREEFSETITAIKDGSFLNEELLSKIEALAEKLNNCSGKKQYGYLPKSVKALVDEIVDDISKDEKISKLYEIWYKAKCAVFNTYTDNLPAMMPLSKEKEFKTIRNALIYEVAKVSASGENRETTKIVADKSKLEKKIKNAKVLSAASKFGNALANIFRGNFKKFVPDYDENEIDKKLRREIEQVKSGENIEL